MLIRDIKAVATSFLPRHTFFVVNGTHSNKTLYFFSQIIVNNIDDTIINIIIMNWST